MSRDAASTFSMLTPVSIPSPWKAMVLTAVTASGAEAAVTVDNVASADRHVSQIPMLGKRCQASCRSCARRLRS